MNYALPLLESFSARYVIADQGYDADYIIRHVYASSATPAIPSKKNRIYPGNYDAEPYKERNRIERCFNKLKNFLKIATRFEKIKTNFAALLHLTCSFLWLS